MTNYLGYKRVLGLLLVLLVYGHCVIGVGRDADRSSTGYAGSVSCRECHEHFYELWSPSHHGQAMQPYTRAFAQSELTEHKQPLTIGKHTYQADIHADPGVVIERGPEGQRRFEIAHALGGKNVYYFLTPYRGGRLQTLPLAYDMHEKQWFDTAVSGVRHFPGSDQDHPVHWTDSVYTFNTACYSCHVSQLSTNYDAKTDTYHTQWAEPGINCETCHGPSERHVKIFQEAKDADTEPNELGLISTHRFTVEQTNSMCNSCHAKMIPITDSFLSGERFFDHYDLIALESIDFYPDGRDLGENYTMTTWRMSPCMQAGELDCMHCHTSSGRYRFKDSGKANGACLPCHQAKVDHVAAHSHHQDDMQCIACHMPMTRFARMDRTDHSMRPPVPAATLKYQSVNACNLCHQDPNQNAAWAQQQLTSWGMTTRQGDYMQLAGYIDQARNRDWQQLDQTLTYIQQPERDEIVTGSLIRLLQACDSEKKWPVLLKILQNDPSPFVRSTAAEALNGYLIETTVPVLLAATRDDYRLVRVRAAGSLASLPDELISADHQQDLDRAMGELMAGLIARPDDYGSHYNLGNVYMQQGHMEQALQAYQTSNKLRPDFIAPYVNAALIYHAQGNNRQAEKSFRQALAFEPNDMVTLTNLALLLGEMERPREAETYYRKILTQDPNSASAAYNLGVLLAERQPIVALAWCEKAYQLQPDDSKIAYTYAFYLNQQHQVEQAMEILKTLTDRQSPYPDAYLLLGHLLEQQGIKAEAIVIYQHAANNTQIPKQTRRYFQMQVQRLLGQ